MFAPGPSPLTCLYSFGPRRAFPGARATITVALLATALVSALSGCNPDPSKTAKAFARPFDDKLRALFDDTTDLCTPWVGSTEPWAAQERDLTSQRSKETDLVAVGRVEQVVDSRAGSDQQAVLHFQVTRMLRGERRDLPEGSGRLTLIVAKGEKASYAHKLTQREAVLTLRWVPGKAEPGFHWHISCLTPGVLELIAMQLKKRAARD